MGPTASLLPCGQRLHLQHGPIDLIIGADGDRQAAFTAAKDRFTSVLEDLTAELPELRLPLSDTLPRPQGAIARRMDAAARPYAQDTFVTRMAAVAGSVADAILKAMPLHNLSRAYVNNGGDIAIHLAKGQTFKLAMMGHDGRDLGRITLHYDDPIRGIASSSRHGRSLSMGIADHVTVLAKNAARADVAATLIANAIDLPDHPAVTRKSAQDCDDNSDLGERCVVVGCAHLADQDISRALSAGRAQVDAFTQRNLISGAALFLKGQSITSCPAQLSILQRTIEYA